ncbi:S8 family serine peptidase [Magnetospira sp. QH-2]|uniref:S8 family serine peptidase n=1 Tax=Magnetospira sp. (strain QH-2) TaxID=1288970 RepID=UPI0003E81533|nr:S8 family serine peptidase [Magnetospira sp. QH-2]CCQ75401.1 putative subtilisin-like peptidase [Magnetospira sp. QH-2]
MGFLADAGCDSLTVEMIENYNNERPCMRGWITRAVVLAAVVLLLSGGSGRAEVKILLYDKQGRVIGVQDADGNKQKSGARDQRGDGPGSAVEPGEVMVLNPPSGFFRAVKRLGYRVIESVNLSKLDMSLAVIKVPPGDSVAGAINTLKRKFPNATFEANHRFEAQAKSERRHARAAMGWSAAPAGCGSGVSMGMIDSGVDVKHPALKNQSIEFRSFHRSSRKPGPSVHGTAVASMLVGNRKWGGLLPEASLKAANIFELTKTGSKVANAAGLLKALDWLAGERVHAINLSVAGDDNKVLRLAVSKARKLGLVLIAAAGNWGRDDKPAYPAAYTPVIAVTAVTGGEAKTIVYRHANKGSWIDFAAPGVKLWTAIPGGGKAQSGTSFAVPFVTAFAAAEVSRVGYLSADKLRRNLRKDTVDLGKPGKDKIYGWGLVDRLLTCR